MSRSGPSECPQAFLANTITIDRLRLTPNTLTGVSDTEKSDLKRGDGFKASQAE